MWPDCPYESVNLCDHDINFIRFTVNQKPGLILKSGIEDKPGVFVLTDPGPLWYKVDRVCVKFLDGNNDEDDDDVDYKVEDESADCNAKKLLFLKDSNCLNEYVIAKLWDAEAELTAC